MTKVADYVPDSIFSLADDPVPRFCGEAGCGQRATHTLSVQGGSVLADLCPAHKVSDDPAEQVKYLRSLMAGDKKK